ISRPMVRFSRSRWSSVWSLSRPPCGRKRTVSSPDQLGGDFRHVATLETGAVQVDRARLARSIPGGDRRRAVGGAADDLAEFGLALEAIGKSDDDHAVMEQGDLGRQHRALLPAMLGR